MEPWQWHPVLSVVMRRRPRAGPGASQWRRGGPEPRALAGEVHQQRVATELEQPATVGRGEVEERDEAGVDGRGELLGPDLPRLAKRSESLVKPEMSTNA